MAPLERPREDHPISLLLPLASSLNCSTNTLVLTHYTTLYYVLWTLYVLSSLLAVFFT